jgi:hypothetical protein
VICAFSAAALKCKGHQRRSWRSWVDEKGRESTVLDGHQPGELLQTRRRMRLDGIVRYCAAWWWPLSQRLKRLGPPLKEGRARTRTTIYSGQGALEKSAEGFVRAPSGLGSAARGVKPPPNGPAPNRRQQVFLAGGHGGGGRGLGSQFEDDCLVEQCYPFGIGHDSTGFCSFSHSRRTCSRPHGRVGKARHAAIVARLCIK